MITILFHSPKCRAISTRFGSLLLLFQRTPLVQFLFPEARVLGCMGLAKITAWTAAAIVGLGAYDTVAGASTLAQITQLAPAPGATTVISAKGSDLTFVFKSTSANSWQIIGALPAGLVHQNATNNSIDSISGNPSQTGSFPFTVRAWQRANQSGSSVTKNFTIIVGNAIIARQPASVTIPSGTSTTLSVGGFGTGLTYQWYLGKSPSTKKPIAQATAATFKTLPLPTKTSYWVRVTRGGIVANSKTATVSVSTPLP